MSEVFKIQRQVAFEPPRGNKVILPTALVSRRKDTNVAAIPYAEVQDLFAASETKIYVLANYDFGKLAIDMKLIDQCW